MTREEIRWAYRLFLDREPENEAVLDRAASNTYQLREEFISSGEFRSKNPILTFNIERWVIAELELGFRLWISLSEMAISRNILYDRYEIEETRFVMNTVKEGDTVIDVGANIGYYAMLLAKIVGPSGSVHAFEPLGYLFDAMVKSAKENGFEDRCSFYRSAVSDRPGRSSIRHAPGTANFGGGYLVSGSDTPLGHVDETVDLVRLDDVPMETRCSFIKIDAEGAEPGVLRGAQQLLARDRPVVLCEILNAGLRRYDGTSGGDLIAQMAEYGYRCSALNRGCRSDALKSYDGDAPINVVFDPI